MLQLLVWVQKKTSLAPGKHTPAGVDLALLFLIRGLRWKEGGTKVQSFDLLWGTCVRQLTDLARTSEEEFMTTS
jgi:hypothetical protein